MESMLTHAGRFVSPLPSRYLPAVQLLFDLAMAESFVSSALATWEGNAGGSVQLAATTSPSCPFSNRVFPDSGQGSHEHVAGYGLFISRHDTDQDCHIGWCVICNRLYLCHFDCRGHLTPVGVQDDSHWQYCIQGYPVGMEDIKRIQHHMRDYS
jgi:hypothetical protein